MDILVVSSVFVFGLIIGSFLNVVILRWNTGMKIANDRSACFSCGAKLKWYELVPLASFIVQRGACRHCRSRLSLQYPLVELAGGLAFVAAYMRASVMGDISGFFPFAAFILAAALLCVYIVIVVYDARHKIIPDTFSYAAGLIALGLVGITWAMTGSIDPYRIVAGPALFLFFWAFWYFSKGAWMGLGDGKLALSIGWALGLSGGLAALLLSFWIGAIVSLIVMAFSAGKIGMKSEIPFGPFLVAGFAAAYLFQLDIPTILSHLAV